MRQEEIKKVITERKFLTGITCNHCKRQIEEGAGYWTVTFSHSDWGRDSIDSFEYKDYCCKECLAVAFLEYIDESGDKKNNPNTMRMDIERSIFYKEGGESSE